MVDLRISEMLHNYQEANHRVGKSNLEDLNTEEAAMYLANAVLVLDAEIKAQYAIMDKMTAEIKEKDQIIASLEMIIQGKSKS